MPPTPLVSLCMMVKNEALTLRRCLDSIVAFADEIVIVDTGSNDGTQEIIRDYQQAKYFFAWNDDFAAARNYVASLATGKYVCRWDADWVLREGDLSKLLTAKTEGFRNATEVRFNWINEFNNATLAPISSVTHMFLYRRELYEWYCAVPAHDMIRPLDPGLEVTKAVYPEIWVYHLKDPVHKAHRYEQTHRLIKDNLRRLPENHPDRVVNLQFYLSSCLFGQDYESALATVREMLPRMEARNDLYTWLLECEITCLLQLHKTDQAYQKAWQYYREYHDYRTVLALADVVAVLEPASAIELYREYLALDKTGLNLEINHERYRTHPLVMLGAITNDRKILQQAERSARKEATLIKLEHFLKKAN